jgi:hypothetical protein
MKTKLSTGFGIAAGTLALGIATMLYTEPSRSQSVSAPPQRGSVAEEGYSAAPNTGNPVIHAPVALLCDLHLKEAQRPHGRGKKAIQSRSGPI